MWAVFLVVAGLLGVAAGAAATAWYFERRRSQALAAEAQRLRVRIRVLEAQLRARDADVFDVDTRIAELWARGWSIRQIAREVGVSKSTVWRKIRKLRRRQAVDAAGHPRREALPAPA